MLTLRTHDRRTSPPTIWADPVNPCSRPGGGDSPCRCGGLQGDSLLKGAWAHDGQGRARAEPRPLEIQGLRRVRVGVHVIVAHNSAELRHKAPLPPPRSP